MDRILLNVSCYTCGSLVDVDENGFYVCPNCGDTWKE